MTKSAAAVLAASTLLIGSGVGAATGFFADETDRGFTIHTAESAPEMAETFDAVEGKFGFVPNLLAVMAESPALLNAYLQTQESISTHGSLSPAEVNVVQLATAESNECNYCVNAHGMIGERMLGQDPGEIASLRMGKSIGVNDKHEALRVFTIAVIEANGAVSDSSLQAFLDAGYTRGQALDVVAGVAAKTMSNFTNRLAQTPLDEPIASYRDSH